MDSRWDPFSAVRNQSSTVATIVRRVNVKVVRASRKPVVAGTRVQRNMVSPPMSVRSERGPRLRLRVDTDNSSTSNSVNAHSVPVSNRRNPIAIHIRPVRDTDVRLSASPRLLASGQGHGQVSNWQEGRPIPPSLIEDDIMRRLRQLCGGGGGRGSQRPVPTPNRPPSLPSTTHPRTIANAQLLPRRLPPPPTSVIILHRDRARVSEHSVALSIHEESKVEPPHILPPTPFVVMTPQLHSYDLPRTLSRSSHTTTSTSTSTGVTSTISSLPPNSQASLSPIDEAQPLDSVSIHSTSATVGQLDRNRPQFSDFVSEGKSSLLFNITKLKAALPPLHQYTGSVTSEPESSSGYTSSSSDASRISERDFYD